MSLDSASLVPLHRTRKGRLQLVTLLTAAVLSVSCGSAETQTTTTTSPPMPGTVTLAVSEVTDATGLIMVSVLGPNLPEVPVGAACAVVDTDPFSFTGAFFPITGPDPCTLGPEPFEFPPGTYEVIVAVMVGGVATPEQCIQSEVAVDGDVTLELSNLGPPTECDLGVSDDG